MNMNRSMILVNISVQNINDSIIFYIHIIYITNIMLRTRNTIVLDKTNSLKIEKMYNNMNIMVKYKSNGGSVFLEFHAIFTAVCERLRFNASVYF